MNNSLFSSLCCCHIHIYNDGCLVTCMLMSHVKSLIDLVTMILYRVDSLGTKSVKTIPSFGFTLFGLE